MCASVWRVGGEKGRQTGSSYRFSSYVKVVLQQQLPRPTDRPNNLFVCRELCYTYARTGARVPDAPHSTLTRVYYRPTAKIVARTFVLFFIIIMAYDWLDDEGFFHSLFRLLLISSSSSFLERRVRAGESSTVVIVVVVVVARRDETDELMILRAETGAEPRPHTARVYLWFRSVWWIPPDGH